MLAAAFPPRRASSSSTALIWSELTPSARLLAVPVASATLLLLVMSWCVSSLFSDLVGIFEVP